MRYLTIILLFIISICFGSDSIFSEANNEYDKENYKLAIDKYHQILSDSLESAELYFNIGNCYYKLQDYANSIFFYEKSLLIDNNFNDALENIELVKIELVDKSEKMPRVFYLNWLESIKNFQNIENFNSHNRLVEGPLAC